MQRGRNRNRSASRKSGEVSESESSTSPERNKKKDGEIPLSEQETYEVFTPVPREEVDRHKFDSLKGLDYQIEVLRSTIVYPVKFPQAFSFMDSTGLRPNVLLYGPAGTGKTDMALSLASETGLPIYQVSSSQIQSSFQGRSKRNFIRLLETAANEPEGAIVFFDEADTLLASGEAAKGESDTSIVNVFKEQVQIGKFRKPEKVIVVAATNFPKRITDVGILSRFSVKIFVGLPMPPLPFTAGAPAKTIAYRTDALIARIDKINKARCGDAEDYVIDVPRDAKVLHDLEALLFFYTPRELDFLAQFCWRHVEVSPFRLREFRYDPVGECTNVYKLADDGKTWSLVRSIEGLPTGSTSSKPSRAAKVAANAKAAPSTAPPAQELTKPENRLLTIDKLTQAQLRGIRWDYITWEHLLKTLAAPGVFPSVTKDSLFEFYDYAKNTLRDYEGVTQILRLIARGLADNTQILSQEFNKEVFRRQIPNWTVPEEIYDDLDERGMLLNKKDKS